MGEDSRRGAPRPARSPGGAGSRPDARTSRPGGRGAGSAGVGARGGSAGRGYGAPGGHRPAGHGAANSAANTARLTSVIEPVLRAMEIDLEAVKLSSAGRRAVLRIVVDADGGLSLDDIAEVSRELSARLDAKNVMGEAPYTLEVTSPGIDRPLTQPRHWRRAAGRLVIVRPLDEEDHKDQGERDAAPTRAEYLGRVIGADHDGVILEIDGARRTFGFGELGPGRVQVEFGRLDEIDDVDGEDLDAQLDDADDSWQVQDIADGGGPDEEGPDGH